MSFDFFFLHPRILFGTPQLFLDLHNIINAIENNNRIIHATLNNTPIEILIDEYDPIYRRFNIRIRINNQTISIGHLRNATPCLLPLAPVIACTFNFQHLRQQSSFLPLHSDLSTLISWINSTKLTDLLQDYINKHQQQYLLLKSTPTSSNNIELQQLVNEKVIVEVQDPTKLMLIATAFKVAKSNGKESRLVYDGQNFDTLIEQALEYKQQTLPKMPPINIRNVTAQILNGWNYISSNDFKSFFYQFQIHPTLSNFFGIKVQLPNGKFKYYKMIVMPQGINFSSSLAQHVALYTKQLLQLQFPNLHFDLVVWIDNILLLTNKLEDDLTLRKAYDLILQQFGIQAKDWETGTQLEVLGLKIDLTQNNKSITPCTRSMEKFTTALNNFTTTPTPRNFLAFHGSAMWMCYVGNIPLCFIPDFMDTIRSESRWIASFKNPSEVPWDTTRKELNNNTLFELCNNIYNICKRARLTQHQHQFPPLHAGFTDASTESMAGISHDNRFAFNFKLSCNPQEIFTTELLAAALYSITLRLHFGDITPRLPWLWIADNTVAKYAILKGHSASTIAEMILRFWCNYGIIPSHVMWVPTKCMKADGFTRSSEFTTNVYNLQNCNNETCNKNNNEHEAFPVPNWNTSVFHTNE